MNHTTLSLLIAAAERARASLHWYSENADGNSPSNPDPDDVQMVAALDEAIAKGKADLAALEAKRAAYQVAGDRSHLLKEFRVVYRAAGEDDPTENKLMTFQAEDVSHVLEQLEGSLSVEDVVVGIVATDGLSLIPEAEDGVVLHPEARGAWITVKNISVHLFHRDGFLNVLAHPYGDESEDLDRQIEVSFSLAALDFFVGSDDSVEGIREHAGHHDARYVQAHLAAYVEGDPDNQTGVAGRVREALAEQLSQS